MNKTKSGVLCGLLYTLIFAVSEFIYFFVILKSESGYANFIVRNTWGSLLHMLFIFLLPYVVIIATLWIVQKSEDMTASCRIAGVISLVSAAVFLAVLLIMKNAPLYAIIYNLFMATGGIRFLNYKRSGKKIANITL